MKTLEELVNSIDFKLLREQKSVLCLLIPLMDTVGDSEALESILSIIDNLQDTIVEAEIKTEEEVFGTL